MKFVHALLFASVATLSQRAGASTVFDDTVTDVQTRLLTTYRPGMPIPVNSPRTIDRAEFHARPPADQYGLRFYSDLQVRRSGSASYFVGDGLPVDAVTGSLPGTLLAMRVGAGLRRLGVYGVLGGGTFTTYRHLIPVRDGEPVQVGTESSPFAFFGIGLEFRIYRSVIFAAEANWGNVIAANGPNRVLIPSPNESVQSAVGALRFQY